MNAKKAGKQDKAYWRNQEYWRVRWQGEIPNTKSAKAYGAFNIACERIQGHAAGWIAGVAWSKRQAKKRKTGLDALNFKINKR